MKVQASKIKFAPFSSPLLNDIADRLPEAIYKGKLVSFIAETSMHPTVSLEVRDDTIHNNVNLRFQDGEFCFSFVVILELLSFISFSML